MISAESVERAQFTGRPTTQVTEQITRSSQSPWPQFLPLYKGGYRESSEEEKEKEEGGGKHVGRSCGTSWQPSLCKELTELL